MRIKERLTVYSYLSSGELMTKILRLAKQERETVLASTIVRKNRHGILKLPKSETVKAEREAHLSEVQNTLEKLSVAKLRLNFRKHNCWVCYRTESNFSWSLARLLEYASLHDTFELKFDRVKEQKC